MHYPILTTIDVEDWFQVENFKKYIPFSSWSSYKLRVEKNTHRILDLLDSTKLNNPTNPTNPINPTNSTNPTNPINPTNPKNPINATNPASPKATFFILGWLVEHLPHLVQQIHSRGHEVASHGYNHIIANEVPSDKLKLDLIDSKKLLEDTIGHRINGYRAPSFFINCDILKIIEDSGYLYDSSYNSFSLHERYGHVDFSQNDRKGIAIQISKTFYELPISNLKLTIKNFELPWGGGGYFRLIPFPFFRVGAQSILRKEKAYLFYMHPWEIDPEQPRVTKASAFYKFRHYTNLKKTFSKLTKFLETFNEHRFITCRQYLEEVGIN